METQFISEKLQSALQGHKQGREPRPAPTESIPLDHQRQRERLVRLLDEMEQEVGPIEPQVMEEVHRSWHARKKAKPRSA